MKTCLRCGFTGQTKTATPGHFALELVLWLCFFVPGFIYSVWRLTARHEPAYSLDQVPSEFIDKLLPATVGVEIRLTRVVAKAKMSQNKMPAEVAGIIAGLSTEAHDTKAELTATWMQEHAVPHAEAREELLEQVARDHGPKRTA